MPVLTTLLVTNLLFGDDVAGVGFLDPRAMRDRIESRLADSEAGEEALRLVDRIDDLAAKYRRSVSDTLQKYEAASRDKASSADELIRMLEPLDRQRTAALLSLVEVRQDLLALLPEEEWARVFE